MVDWPKGDNWGRTGFDPPHPQRLAVRVDMAQVWDEPSRSIPKGLMARKTVILNHERYRKEVLRWYTYCDEVDFIC